MTTLVVYAYDLIYFFAVTFCEKNVLDEDLYAHELMYFLIFITGCRIVIWGLGTWVQNAVDTVHGRIFWFGLFILVIWASAYILMCLLDVSGRGFRVLFSVEAQKRDCMGFLWRAGEGEHV